MKIKTTMGFSLVLGSGTNGVFIGINAKSMSQVLIHGNK